jgi:hypothetical protein
MNLAILHLMLNYENSVKANEDLSSRKSSSLRLLIGKI